MSVFKLTIWKQRPVLMGRPVGSCPEAVCRVVSLKATDPDVPALGWSSTKELEQSFWKEDYTS